MTQKKYAERFASLQFHATDIYIYIMVTVFPLFTGLNGYFSLNQKKFVFFAVVTLCWMLILFITTVLRLFGGGRCVMRLIDWVILMYMAACILSTIISTNASFLSLSTGRCDGLLTYLLYGCIVLGVSRFGTARKKYLYAFGVSYTICCLIALIQLLGFNPLYLYPRGYNFYDPAIQEVVPFLGTIGNINLLSALHCLAIPIMLAGFFYESNAGHFRFIMLIPVVLGLLCAVAARVSSGILALTVMVLVFFPICMTDLKRSRSNSSQQDKHIKKLFCKTTMVSALAFAMIILTVYFWPANDGAIWELKSVLHGDVRDEFGSSRIMIWRNVMHIICKHPLVGVGPDCLGNELNVSFNRYSVALGETIYTYADNAHNEYLNILVSFGLFGFIPVILAQAISWIQIKQNRCCSRLISQICPGLFCYMVQAFFNIGLCITTPLFCIFWALALLPKTSSKGEDYNVSRKLIVPYHNMSSNIHIIIAPIERFAIK